MDDPRRDLQDDDADDSEDEANDDEEDRGSAQFHGVGERERERGEEGVELW